MTRSEPPAAADYLLIVATQTEEEQLRDAAAALQIPFVARKAKIPLERRLRPYYELGLVGRNRVNAIRIEMGPHGLRGSASAALRWSAACGSQGMVCLGIAFGIDSTRQEIGDVLVSRSLLPYDDREVSCTTHRSGPRTWWPPWRTLRSSATPHHRYAYPRAKAFLSHEPLFLLFQRHHDIRPREHRVYFGSMLTGGSKVMCEGYRDQLAAEVFAAARQRGEKHDAPAAVVGGEMEGVGLLSACDSREPNWIIVKGISDFADGRQSAAELAHSRLIAARNAAEFVFTALLEEAVHRPSAVTTGQPND